MDFFEEKDLALISEYAGEEWDKQKHNELRKVYDKLGHLCSLINK